ncbi:cell division protein FtsQ/DivIB [Arsenophonus symbiont of Ornithomya chloropus]|uniref:cell division protein FtsQ/DivIB n=1 Tax=Arsenophonus symbiont of Ornithomya chloropus TaxID=634121 RepID=UPI0032B2E427
MLVSFNIYNKEFKKYKINNVYGAYYWFGLIVFVILLAIMILSGCILLDWMKDFHQLPISKLSITGKRNYTSDSYIRKVILELGIPGTFMNTDINIIHNQIKRISWIKQVTIRKKWPNELTIHLVEYQPYAKWNDTFFINKEGIIFNIPELINSKKNFLMLYGPEGSQQEILNMYHIMQNQLSENNFIIKSLSMSTRRAWQLVLVNDIKLNIGKQDIKERLNRFMKLYPLLKKVKNKRIGYVDLRYASNAAVGWLPI